MFKKALAAFSVAGALALLPPSALAAGNLASLPTELDLHVDGAALTFSQTEFELETGKYYKLVLSSDGLEQVDLKAPDLWENSWINQVEINDVDVYLKDSNFHIGFDNEGEAAIFFVPLRPGNYQLYADGFQERGLVATFIVR